MPRGKQSKGSCRYCETEITKGGVAKHLAACPQRRIVIEKAEQGKAKKETLLSSSGTRCLAAILLAGSGNARFRHLKGP